MENISKIVFALSSGERLGYVLDICLSEEGFKKTGYYVVEESSESVCFLPLECIKNISVDAIVIEEESVLEFVSAKEESLFGKQIFDEAGVCFGSVQNLVFEKNILTKLVTEKCEVLAKFVKKISSGIVLISFAKKKRAKKVKDKAQIFATQSENKVEIMFAEKAPQKINLSPSFYLGKTALFDIMGYNNEKVISKGEVVTKNILERARMHNKMNQLFFAINRNI